MRRPFPRTSGSPQAPAIVETPAHYAPTLFCRLALLSEVVIGSVEPTMSCASFENTSAKLHKLSEIAAGKDKNIKNSGKYGGKRYMYREYSLSLQ